MTPSLATILEWSYGIAAVFYGAYALWLVGARRRRGLRDCALLAATGLAAVWGLSVVAYAVLESPLWLLAGATADVLRNGAWFAFLLALMDRSDKSSAEGGARDRVLLSVAAAIVAWGLLAQFLIVAANFAFGHPARVAAYGPLAAAVVMLIILQQHLRNTEEATRWGRMPVCRGTAAA